MINPEDTKILKEWPLILVPMVRDVKTQDEIVSISLIGQLIQKVQGAQRAMDIEFYLPFQEEQKVELREILKQLYEKHEAAKGYTEDDAYAELSNFLEKNKEKLTF